MLQAGEYRLYTSEKLETPDFVGVNDHFSESEQQNLHVFPNPATTELNILYNFNGGYDNLQIALFDVTGKMVKRLKTTRPANGLNQYRLDINGLNAGIYFLTLEVDGRLETEKVIIR